MGAACATGSLDGTARLWDTQAANPAADPQVLPGDKRSSRRWRGAPTGVI